MFECMVIYYHYKAQGEIMKNTTVGTLSGCVLWILSIGVISSCILPIFFLVGSITSFSQYAIKATGNFLCPDGTTAKRYSYQTTTTDEYGNRHPSTAYELHCVDQNGNVVKEDPIVFSFLWIGGFRIVRFDYFWHPGLCICCSRRCIDRKIAKSR